MARRSKLARASAIPLCAMLLCTVVGSAAAAQDATADTGEPLVTDRPDFTESAETVARGRVQVEGGYTFTEREAEDEQSLGEVLVRVGLSQRFELRLGLDSWVHLDPAGPGRGTEGFADPSVGAKLVLRADTDQRTSSPQLALLFGTTLPIGSSDLREPHAQPFAVLAASWGLRRPWT
jgi:hypothetical protein